MKKVGILGALILFLSGIVLRLWRLGTATFGGDNMEFYKLALRNQDIIEFWKNPPWLNQIPLNETFTLLLIKAGLPATPFVVRLPFAIMGILALFFVWRFARKRAGVSATALVLLLAAFNPYQVYFSRTAYHNSGALCWSAALFCVFWSLKEKLEAGECLAIRSVVLWFATAALACHMHMSVWVAAGTQGFLLLVFGWRGLRGDGPKMKRFFISMGTGAILLALLLSRWVFRAAQRINEASSGGKQLIGSDASSEIARLLPAYFVGETVWGVALLLGFLAIVLVAMLRRSPRQHFFCSLALVFGVQLVAMIGYVAVVGGGVAKISYFSPIWPSFILLLGLGVATGIQSLTEGRRVLRGALWGMVLVGYLAMSIPSSWAIVHLDGKPKPYNLLKEWLSENVPDQGLILMNAYLEAAVKMKPYTPSNMYVTFTVPDIGFEMWQQNRNRPTSERFLQTFNDAFLIEQGREYNDRVGPWKFTKDYFARHVMIHSRAADTLRRMKLFPVAAFGGNPDVEGLTFHLYYNRSEDLVQKAREGGQEVLRIWAGGWGYAKTQDYRDWRVLSQTARLQCHNLTPSEKEVLLTLHAVAAGGTKRVRVGGKTLLFPASRPVEKTVSLRLPPGGNNVRVSGCGQAVFNPASRSRYSTNLALILRAVCSAGASEKYGTAGSIN